MKKWTTNQIKPRTENRTKETRQKIGQTNRIKNRTIKNWTKNRTSDFENRTLDIRHQIGHKTSEICYFGHLTLDIKHWR